MAGLFLSFFVEYISRRIVRRRSPSHSNGQTGVSVAEETEKAPHSSIPDNPNHHLGTGLANTKISVLVTEAGIIFHSIRKPGPPHVPSIPCPHKD